MPKTLDEMSNADLTRTYPFIAAWGEQLGSNAGYVLNQMRWAFTEQAPRTAIYRKNDHGLAKRPGWVTVDEIQDEDVWLGTVAKAGHVAARARQRLGSATQFERTL